DFLRARRQPDIASNCAITTANDEFDSAANLVELDTKIAEHFCRNAFTFAYKAQQQMLGANVIVVKALGLLLRKLQDFACPLGEFVEAISHLCFTPFLKRNQQHCGTDQTIATAARFA